MNDRTILITSALANLALLVAVYLLVEELFKRSQQEKRHMAQELELQGVIGRIKTAAGSAQVKLTARIESLTAKNDQTTEVDLTDEIADLTGIETLLIGLSKLGEGPATPGLDVPGEFIPGDQPAGDVLTGPDLNPGASIDPGAVVDGPDVIGGASAPVAGEGTDVALGDTPAGEGSSEESFQTHTP